MCNSSKKEGAAIVVTSRSAYQYPRDAQDKKDPLPLAKLRATTAGNLLHKTVQRGRVLVSAMKVDAIGLFNTDV